MHPLLSTTEGYRLRNTAIPTRDNSGLKQFDPSRALSCQLEAEISSPCKQYGLKFTKNDLFTSITSDVADVSRYGGCEAASCVGATDATADEASACEAVDCA